MKNSNDTNANDLQDYSECIKHISLLALGVWLNQMQKVIATFAKS